MTQIQLDTSWSNVGGFELKKIGSEESVFFQSDWDYPAIASHFGFIPCKCEMTDGTVDCLHKTASQMISEAYDFLLEHDGEIIEDPGYFED